MTHISIASTTQLNSTTQPYNSQTTRCAQHRMTVTALTATRCFPAYTYTTKLHVFVRKLKKCILLLIYHTSSESVSAQITIAISFIEHGLKFNLADECLKNNDKSWLTATNDQDSKQMANTWNAPADFSGSRSTSAHFAYCRNTAYNLAGDTDRHTNADIIQNKKIIDVLYTRAHS